MKRPWAFICASEGATSKHLRNYCREVYLLGYLPVCPKLQDSQYLVLEDAVERSEYSDTLVARIIERIEVISAVRIKIEFIGGYTVTVPLQS